VTSSPKWAFHSFEFGDFMGRDNQGIHVINFRYGDSTIHGTHSDGDHANQGTSVGGRMPVGDYLYVKWRVLATDKVYEDKVDLKSRLPSNMEDKTVYFMIKEQQLSVYVITEHGHTSGQDCPVALYGDRGCTRIHPDHWSNFGELKS
jgi:hypothetical protein